MMALKAARAIAQLTSTAEVLGDRCHRRKPVRVARTPRAIASTSGTRGDGTVVTAAPYREAPIVASPYVTKRAERTTTPLLRLRSILAFRLTRHQRNVTGFSQPCELSSPLRRSPSLPPLSAPPDAPPPGSPLVLIFLQFDGLLSGVPSASSSVKALQYARTSSLPRASHRTRIHKVHQILLQSWT